MSEELDELRKEHRQLEGALIGCIAGKAALHNQLHDKKQELHGIKYRLGNIISMIDDAEKVIYSSWVVLLKRNGDGFESIGCFDSNNWPEEIPDFDVCLGIPIPETLKEWEGP